MNIPPRKRTQDDQPVYTDKSKDLGKWYFYPEMLPNQRFGGFEDRDDATQLRGKWVVGQNVTFGGNSLPSNRPGYEVIGTEAADSTSVRRAWLYETREGAQFELKVYNTGLYYFLFGISAEFELLQGGFTPGLDWGFANIGKSSDATAHVRFSNGTDGMWKFSGAYAILDSSSNDANVVVSWDAIGGLATVGVTAAGLGYVVNDILTLTTGGGAGQVRVTSTGGGGTITGLSVETVGTGYNTGGGQAVTGGTGTGATVNVTAVTSAAGSGYAVGDTITLTTGGTGATFSVLTVTGSGGIKTVLQTAPGSGYGVAVSATSTSGAGINASVSILDVGTGWIKKTGAQTFAEALFYTSSDKSVTISGSAYSYANSGANSLFLADISPSPAALAAGSIIVQTPVHQSDLDGVQGNIMAAHDGRLHMDLQTKQSVWNFSKLDNPDNFTVASPDVDGNAGSKEVEFGGPITAFGKLNKTILCFKKREIKLLDFVQSGSRVDLSRYATLVSADDKGTTLGANNQKSVFSTPSGMVFVTADKRLALLSGVTANNEPQYLFLSDPVQPIFTNGVFDDAAGICVDNVIYLAFKQDINSTYNDTVIRGDMTRQSIDNMGRILPVRWDAPYIGWTVSDWTAVYDNTAGANQIHWHSSLNSNSYRLIKNKSDNTQGFTSIIRSWSEHFDHPTLQKKIEEAFIEVRMTENTSLLATILYDEDGFTGRDETECLGTTTINRFGGTPYNPFGASPFGSEKFGSNTNSDLNPVYRFFLEVNNNIYFFNLALQLGTDDPGQDFELIRFGWKVTEIQPETDHKYLTD